MKRKKMSAGQFQAKRAADRGEDVEDGHDAKAVAASELLSGNAGGHGADDGAHQGAGDGDAEQGRREVIGVRQGRGGAGDDGGVEAEEQAAEGSDDGAFYYMRVDAHSVSMT